MWKLIPSCQECALDKAMQLQGELAKSEEELARTQVLVGTMEAGLLKKAGCLLLISNKKIGPGPVKQESSEEKSREEVRACSHVLCLEKRP